MATNSEASDWQPMGTHLVRQVDDVTFLKVRGDIGFDDIRGLIERGTATTARTGYYLTVVDASAAGTMTPEARRLSAQWSRDNPDKHGSDVVYGASMMARAIITMINRATTLITQRSISSHFVKDEAAALALVTEERLRLQAEVARTRRS